MSSSVVRGRLFVPSSVLTIGLALSVACHGAAAGEIAHQPDAETLRRPVALAHHAAKKCLLSANRDSGSISIIDLENMQVVNEVVIGNRLSALAVIPQTNLFVATDEAAHEVILFSCDGHDILPRSRLDVGHTPVDVQVTADGTHCFVSSLWARQVTSLVIDRSKPGMTLDETLAMPFAPRKQLLSHHGGSLIVADSFGGHLAVVDTNRMSLTSVTHIEGCNIRGLAQSPDGEKLLVAHQNVNRLAHSTKDDLRWGLLVTNHVRIFDMEDVVYHEEPDPDIAPPEVSYRAKSQLVHLGDFGHGAGDPAELVVTRRGKVLIALAGVNQLGVAGETDLLFQHIDVGQRPTALVWDDTNDRAYVANTFSDSISVVDTKRGEVTDELELGPTSPLDSEDQGEVLFFDARVSFDGWMSCHSCHTDGHTNGLLADTLTDGAFGSPKKVLSLLGVSATAPLAWNGSFDTLDQQIESSLKNTMHHKGLTSEQVGHMSAYLSTLPPAPASSRTTEEVLAQLGHVSPDVARGAVLFERLECGACHTPPTYTSPDVFDVDLVDEHGHHEFNPPSLRGVSQRQRFFHDGRAQSLTDVFARYQHQITESLSQRDVGDLVSYLHTI
jgi:YVTN family beta-propeller protein